MNPLKPSPPRWAHWLLTRFHPDDTLEEVAGDLDELYRYWYRRAGRTQATMRYLLNVVSVLPPFVRQRQRKQEDIQQTTHPLMIRRFVTQLIRRLAREKTYSLLNIVGLSAGLSCFVFIALWVQDELSFDTFHANADRIVRLTTAKKTETGLLESARTGAPMAKALRDDYAEVENTVRLDRRGEIVQHDNRQTLENDILLTDPSFFQIFNYPLTRGNPATALAEPYSVVLTESTARKYFGQADPMGQSLLIYMYDTGQGASYKVTGLTPDPPKNAHFTFSMLGSFKTIETARPQVLTAEGWSDNRYHTYLLLKKGVDPNSFSRKIAQFYARYVGDQLTIWRFRYSFRLQPLRDIHLRSHLDGEMGANGHISQVYIFSTIGLFILILAAINYTNLATARSLSRAKEVSVKKVVGAIPAQLIRHYLAESVVIALLALILAVGLSGLLQPFFVQLTGKTRSLFNSPLLLLFLTGVTVCLGILAGAYPAFVLSKFRPATVLKGAFRSGTRGIALRQFLIVFQFVITLLLITSIVIMHFQMRYIRHKDLGFRQEALVFIRLNGNADVVKGYDAFRNELMASPLVSGVASSRSGIGNGLETLSAESVDRQGKLVEVTTAKLPIDADYPAVYGLKLLAGRNLTPRATGDTMQQIILNERAVSRFGWKNPETAIGKPFRLDNQPGTVVGVVRDFHFHSLQHTIEPLAISLRDGYFTRITVKIAGDDISRSLAFIEQTWKKHFPVALFDYDFVDHLIAEQYQAEERFATIILYFSVLSLVIACLGLYGLIAYSTTQKTKEIGIRKTLGASAGGIVMLLSKEFLKLVGLSCLIALPAAWYLMRQWLQDFAYQVEVEWWMFTGPVAGVIIIALLTVSSQTIKAALVNPVRSLRSE